MRESFVDISCLTFHVSRPFHVSGCRVSLIVRFFLYIFAFLTYLLFLHITFCPFVIFSHLLGTDGVSISYLYKSNTSVTGLSISWNASDSRVAVRSEGDCVVALVMVVVRVIVMTVAGMVARVMVVIEMMASGFTLRLKPYLTAVSTSHLTHSRDEPQHQGKKREHTRETTLGRPLACLCGAVRPKDKLLHDVQEEINVANLLHDSF